MVNTELTRLLHLPRLGQVGMVVKDMEKTMNYYRDTFGIRPWVVFEGEPVFAIERGKSVKPTLKIGLSYIGNVQIELIQVLKGKTYHTDLLEKGEGLHHLGFMVKDLDKRLDACSRLGIDVIQKGRISSKGFTVDYAYLDTVKIGGVIFEFIQTRLGPMKITMSPAKLKLAAALGL